MNTWLELNGWWKLYNMPPQIFKRGWMHMLWMPPMQFLNPSETSKEVYPVTVEFLRDFDNKSPIKPPCNPEYPIFRGRTIP